MISTEQKTEHWIVGVLIKFVSMGRYSSLIYVSGDNLFYDEVDWWELDETRQEWVDGRIMTITAARFLKNIPEPYKSAIWQEIVYFFYPDSRIQYLIVALNHLFQNSCAKQN